MGSYRNAGIARLADSVVASGYASIVLDRLARQARQLVGAEGSCMVVRDRRTPGTTVAVAGCGPDQEFVGDRFVEPTLAALLDAATAAPGQARTADPPYLAGRRRRMAVPIRRGGEIFGALTAGAAADGSFGDEERAILSEVAALAGAAVLQAERRNEIRSGARARVVALVQAIDARDGYTAAHSETVVQLSLALGRRRGLSAPDLLELELAALLHDLGKVAVPDAILNKPAALDPEEQRIMREHAEGGARRLTNVPGLQAVATIVRCHHERWDGTGYPRGLLGDRIPIASRVVAVCDAYDAMTSDRPYRQALSQVRALDELFAGAGSQFDPGLVALLPGVLSETHTAPT